MSIKKKGDIMSIKVRSHLVVLYLIFTLIMSACSNDKSASQDAKEFISTYFEIVECIDLGNTLKSLEQLQSEQNSMKIEHLGVLLKNIKSNVPKDNEKLYDTNKLRYENLLFLKESYSKLQSLTEDERGKIDSIFISIGLDKKNWNDKGSSIIWD